MTDREVCFELYKVAFGDDEPFDTMMFDSFFDNCKTLKKDGEIVSMVFFLPCKLIFNGKNYKAHYFYAAVTDPKHRGKGYMTELIKSLFDEGDAFFLKPANDGLIKFYENAGLRKIEGVSYGRADATVIPTEQHKRLSALCDVNPETYTLMFYSKKISLNSIMFSELMQ